MEQEDYKIAYENVMIANKMLEQENKQLEKKYENAVSDYEQEHYKVVKAIEYIKQQDIDIFSAVDGRKLLDILGDKENGEI